MPNEIKGLVVSLTKAPNRTVAVTLHMTPEDAIRIGLFSMVKVDVVSRFGEPSKTEEVAWIDGSGVERAL